MTRFTPVVEVVLQSDFLTYSFAHPLTHLAAARSTPSVRRAL